MKFLNDPDFTATGGPSALNFRDKGGQVFNAKAYGLTGDGSTDDSAALTALIATAGGKTIFFPDGTYIIENVNVNVAKTTLTGSSGALLKKKSAGAASIILVKISATDCTVDGLAFDGNAYANCQIILLSSGADRACVRRCRLNNPVLGIYLQNAVNDVLIAGNVFTGNGYGVLTHDNFTGARLSICNNTFVGGTTGDAIEINTPGSPVSRPSAGATEVSIVGNTISNYSDTSTNAGIGIGLAHVQGATVSGNLVYTTRGNGIHIEDGSTNITVTGNRVSGCYGGGIIVLAVASPKESCKNVTITGNTVSGCATGVSGEGGICIETGSSAVGSDGIIVANNIVTNNGNAALAECYGIYLQYDCRNTTVSGNIVKNTTAIANSGIKVTQGTNLNITENRCYDDQTTKTQQYGLKVAQSQTNYHCSGNDFSGNLTAPTDGTALSAVTATQGMESGAVPVFDVKDFGAVGIGRVIPDAYVTSTSTTLTSYTARFTANDVGLPISVDYGAAASAVLVTTIAAYISSTQVTMAVAAGATQTNVTAAIGYFDDTVAIQKTIDAANGAGGGVVYFPAGLYHTTGITLYSKIAIKGSGFESTIIRKKNGSSNDVIIGSGFSGLTGKGILATVTNATNATPIAVTVTAHGYSTGDTITVQSVTGNTAANGLWAITQIDANTFSLNGSVGNGAYVSGGSSSNTGGIYAWGLYDITIDGNANNDGNSQTTLASSMTSGSTTAVVVSSLFLAASGSIVIGENAVGDGEVIAYTSNNTSTNTLSGLTRGQEGTVAVSHTTSSVVDQRGAGYGVRVYGYGFTVSNVRIRRCQQGGWYSEWSRVSSTPRFTAMSACVVNLECHQNSGHGIQWAGPHDTSFATVLSWSNNLSGIRIQSGSTGSTFVAGHCYGNQTYAWDIGDSVNLVSCVGEEGVNAQMVIRTGGGGSNMDNMSLFDVTAGRVGLALDVGGVTNLNFRGTIQGTTGGSIDWTGDAGNNLIIATINQASGNFFIGAPATSTQCLLVPYGGAAAGTVNNLQIAGPSFLGGNTVVSPTKTNAALGAFTIIKNDNTNVDFVVVSKNGGAYNAYWDIAATIAGKFAFYDALGAVTPFTLEKNGQNNTWYVAANGCCGQGTAAPTYGIHQLGGGNRFAALASPAQPTLVKVGASTTATYAYAVVAKDRAGNTTLASTTSATQTNAATLDASNYNTVNWSSVPGAISYNVYRITATSATGNSALTGLLTSGTSITALTFNDQGGAASGAVPTRNATADSVIDGNLSVGTAGSAGNGILTLAGTTSGTATLAAAATASGAFTLPAVTGTDTVTSTSTGWSSNLIAANLVQPANTSRILSQVFEISVNISYEIALASYLEIT